VELTELAQNYFGDTRSGSVVAPIGTLVILALTVVTVLLIRNMNARLRRLPERFPDEKAPPDSAKTDTDHRTG
jgi:hypothetical protein